MTTWLVVAGVWALGAWGGILLVRRARPPARPPEWFDMWQEEP